MLGSEYNWLLKLTHSAGGAPKIGLEKSSLFTLAIAIFCFLCLTLHAASPPSPAASASIPAASIVIDVRQLGAIGDGGLHLIGEWIAQGRFPSLREVRRACPAIQGADWSVDEAAFEMAKSKLPPEGGTIYFPAGRYVAAHRSWTVMKDNVRLLGDGPEQSILLTQPGIQDALVLSPYRHVGWRDAATEQYPFRADTGKRGADSVTLLDHAWTGEFHAGDLVFIRNGGCRFDQDYGEFNEVGATGANGELRFKHALSRDYTLERLNWAGTVASDFPVPRIRRSVTVLSAAGEGNSQPRAGETVTVGGQLFEVAGTAGHASLRLLNPGRGNVPPDTKISAGAKIALSRAVIKVTESTRNFRAEKLQFIGHRKVLNLSNSYGMEFIDCRFTRKSAADNNTKGGLTIDGDGGRDARFVRCTLKAEPPWGMQFARSFGDVTFDSCTFLDANVAFTEFCFNCTVINSDFDFHGPSPQAVIVIGKSGGEFRLLSNRIRSHDAAFVFDSLTDIQSQKHRGEGAFIIRGNAVNATGNTQVFRLNSNLHADLSDNSVLTGP